MKLHYNKYIDPYIHKILNNEVPHNIEQEQMIINNVIPVLDRDDVIIDSKKIEDGLSLQKYFDYQLNDWETFLFALIVGVFFSDYSDIFFNEIYGIVGRGAGKNGFINFVAFYFLSPYHGIKNYNIDILANSEEQASTSFDDLYDLITDNPNPANKPALKKYFSATKNLIVGKKTNSKMKKNTSSPGGKDSKRTGAIIVDEKHEYTRKNALAFYNLKSGLGKIPFARIITITSDGLVRGGPLDQDKVMFKDVLSQYNPKNRKLIFWCRIEKEEEWKDPNSWIKANPSINDFPVLRRTIEAEVADMVYTPDYFPIFMAKRMNFPIGDRTIEVAKWDDLIACDKELPLEELKGKKCIGCLDFAKTDDFVVCGLLFKYNNRYYFLHHTFVCKNSSDLIGISAPLDDWEQMGMLEYVDDVEIPTDLISGWFEARMNDGFQIVKMAIDNFRYSLVSSALKKIGFSDEYKNIKLVRPSDLMMASPIINSIFLRHNLSWGISSIPGIQCIMCWYTNNVKKALYNGNVRFEKIEEHYRKTDGFMAYANGVTLIEELDEEDLVLDDTVKKIMTTLTF